MVAGLRAVRAPVLVLRLYIETVLEVILATYAEAPSAETAMPRGYDPVAMVPIEVRMPVLVPPSAVQLVVGVAVVAQHVPLAVRVMPPLEVTLAPSVTPVGVMEVAVGEVTVGSPVTLNVPLLVKV